VITPPTSAPPLGLTYTLYDTDGNELYSTTGVYEPGSTSAAYSQTAYQLFNGNNVTLPGTSTQISCAVAAPSMSLPCATIDANGVVTQLEYDAQGDVISSSTPDGNGSQLATTTDTYNADGEELTEVSPDGNVTGANVGNYTTTTAYNADGRETSVTEAGEPAIPIRLELLRTGMTRTGTRRPSRTLAASRPRQPTTPTTSRPWSPTRTATRP
jgi:YD repeat-containing protein